ncbi:MAG: GvpL/GvpF family gas vesicle protein [Chloroflexota bacterium]
MNVLVQAFLVFLDRPEVPLPALPGLGEAPLLSLVYREIAAVASRLAAPDNASVPPATEANLWRHEAIVEALMGTRAVLPVSFGAVLADEAALQAILATRYTGFVTDLRRVSGRVELSVQVLLDDDAGRPPPADCGNHTGGQPSVVSGHAYMLARLEAERQAQVRRQRAEALATDIHARLARLADESTHLILVTSHLLLKAAYLVPRERVTDFRQEVESLCLAYPRLRFLCTGPWPAYSFITNDEAATQRLVPSRCCAETLTREPPRSTLCFLSESGNEQEHKDARD